MAEPLKNLFDRSLVSTLSGLLASDYAEFDSDGFQKRVFEAAWEEKELKQRIEHIADMLHAYLPVTFEQAIEILKPASLHFSGLQHMIFPAFVEFYGLEDFDISMPALAYFTNKSSSEFAIRPFIKQSPVKTMNQMENWAGSDNEHLRRLASEGCRPRLPWAMSLPDFKRDPRPVLRILEKLKNDNSLYVRRSVANNLNDISKDNPELVIDIAKSWLGKNPDTDWLVKHACRSLLKQAESQLMQIFGFAKPTHITIPALEVQQSVNFGERLRFSFELKTSRSELGKLRIEYAIDFMKKNGNQSRKIFKISESDNLDQYKKVIREHSFKYISTRTYYPGVHGIAVIVNGHELKTGNFQLNMEV